MITAIIKPTKPEIQHQQSRPVSTRSNIKKPHQKPISRQKCKGRGLLAVWFVVFYGDFVQRSELACGERVWEIIVANGEREGFQQ